MHIRNAEHETVEIPNPLFLDLEAQLEGRLIRPMDSDYHEARSVWNGMIDRYPAVIVRCHSTADVVATVNFARRNHLLISVRGGGHNVSGNAVRDGALVIDMSEMTHVQVDPVTSTVTAQGGARWLDVDVASQKVGLAVPGGLVSDTGIAGLTLGGGLGWLRRKYGLSCDSLIGATVVTANGDVLFVSEERHSDLLWALRGGGGQFGIVTEFVYRAYPVDPNVAFTFVMHGGQDMAAALRFYREYITDIPDDLSTMAVLGHVPAEEHFPEEAHNLPFVLFGGCFAGDPVQGQRLMQPLREYATPIVDASGIIPYTQMQTTWDEDYPAGELRYYWKSAYINALSDKAITEIVDYAHKAPSPLSTVDIWHLGGAIRHFGSETSAFGERNAEFLLGIESNWEDATDDDRNIAWARELSATMEPLYGGQRYLNFPGFHEEDGLMEVMFGSNAERVQAIKAAYDPGNMFSLK
jgi:FAD/FMN-containing dehydrogenase